MRIRVNIANKMLIMVTLPIILLCIIIGVFSGNSTRNLITEEIELQLKLGAYSAGQSLTDEATLDVVNEHIYDLNSHTSIDLAIFDADAVRIASTIDNAVGTSLDKDLLRHINENKSDYFTTSANINGEAYFGYYIPYYDDSNTLSGIAFAGLPKDGVDNSIRANAFKLVGVILGCGIIFVGIAIIFIMLVVKRIKGLEKTVNTLLSKDLRTQYHKTEFGHDEIEELNNKTIDFAANLHDIIWGIDKTSTGLKAIADDLNINAKFSNETCNQISQAVESIANGAVTQSESTSLASDNVTKMSNELSEIMDNANDLNDIANSMNNAKSNVVTTLDNLKVVNETIVCAVDTMNNQVKSTNESVNQIKKAVGMIKDIANQTKLLSLNASIEAAHAGEHGKGFAVVADEIGKLASESAESSDEIEQILKQLVQDYNAIIVNVNNTSSNISEQSDKVEETQEVFTVLEGDINSTVEKISNITDKVESLNSEINDIVSMLTSLSDISEENSAATEQTMASIQELNAVIGQLSEKAQHIDNSSEQLIKEIQIFEI